MAKKTISVRGAYEDQVKLKDGRLVTLSQYLEEKAKKPTTPNIVGVIRGAYATQVKTKSGKILDLSEFVRSHQKTDEIATVLNGTYTSQVKTDKGVEVLPSLVQKK